jgi:K(+)-stimulated pyrophosphate-energized sodium pump
MWTIGSIIVLGLFGIATGLVFALRVRSVPPTEGIDDPDQARSVLEIGAAIAEGAAAFLRREYTVVGGFMVVFALVVWLLMDWESALAFLVGASISMGAGFIGMKAATTGNLRTASAANSSLARAFRIAFNSGAVMGFALVGMAVLGLIVMYLVLDALMPGASREHVMEALAGFGLGGSAMALFARVGGGIYTKAADVGADLVGKLEENIPEDDPRNPAVIADNVGDCVGDTAGMGADLFGSLAESTCAALVIGAVAFAAQPQALLYPLLISAVGIPMALVASWFARTNDERMIETALKRSIVVCTLLMAVVLFFLTRAALPETFSFGAVTYSNLSVYFCVLGGLIAGILIGVVTEYFTSHRYAPVRAVATASQTGAATNILYGLALGYQSSLLPVLFIAASVFVGYYFAGMYGIAVAALGMLSTLAVGLTIDGFGPVGDNAGGIAEMAGLGVHVRRRTDALDAAGNTTACIGKGFAIGSAALTSLALISAFLVRSEITVLDILKPASIAFLLVGGMLPFIFMSMTMKSVGRAAMDIITEVRRQFATIPGLRASYQLTEESLTAMAADGIGREHIARLRPLASAQHANEAALLHDAAQRLGAAAQALPPERLRAYLNRGIKVGRADYRRCVDIVTRASLREMILPGAQVIVTPIVVGYLFGPEPLAALLIGSLVAGVVLAVTSVNAGGGWDNAKKYIEAGNLGGKGSTTHAAAVVGDTIGDPFKDTSGPSLNILIKLQAIISLVFAPFFAQSLNLLG